MLRAMIARQHHRSGARPETYRGHWAIFLPSVVVALLYGGAWIGLLVTGRSDTALAKLALLVLLLVVPLLVTVACLRFRSLRIEVGPETVAFRQGWLRPRWTRLRYADIDAATVRWSRLGRTIGSGALQLRTGDGTAYRILDVAVPEAVAQRINEHARSELGRSP